MGSKISIYGLSGSGKSCYIYAMTQAMRKGIRFDNGYVLTVVNSNLAQVNLLNSRFSMMTSGMWPPGTSETTEFTYTSRLAFKYISDVTIRDYRGGIFTSIEEEDLAEIEDLYKSFKDSGSLAFFIGVDKLMMAMQGDVDAFNDLGLMHTLYAKFLESYPDDKTPVIFVLTKSDLATPNELENCKNFIREEFAAFFGAGTGLTVALTAVTLGHNLSCGADNELIGELRVGPSEGNIQIPVLFTLFGIYSQLITQELDKNAAYNNYLAQHQIDLERERSKGFFARLFTGKERLVRAQLINDQAKLDKTKQNLVQMDQALELIKTRLKGDVEIYIDGELQNF